MTLASLKTPVVTWLAALWQRRPARAVVRAKKTRYVRLRLEVLENRVVLSTAPQAAILSVSAPQQEGTLITVVGSATVQGDQNHTVTESWAVFQGTSTTPFASGGNTATFTFTPGRFGSYQIVLTVTEDTGDSATASRNITVSDVRPKTIGIPALNVLESADPVTVQLPLDFSDPGDGAAGLSYSVVNDTNTSLFSSVSFDTPGSLTLAFTPQISGAATLTIQATDTGGLFVQTPLNVTVLFVNHPPVRVLGTITTLTVGEDAPATSLGLGNLAYGPGGGAQESQQTLSYRAVTLPSTGDVLLPDKITLVKSGMALTLDQLHGLVYHNHIGSRGSSSFVFNVQDNGGAANGGNDTLQETVPIAITPFNNPPTTTGLADVTSVRDAAPTAINLFPAFHHVDYPDTALTYQVTANSNPALIQTAITPGNPTLLTLSYVAGAIGTASITVQATDPVGLTVSTSFNVTVVGPDLLGTSFKVLDPSALWDATVRVGYTIANQGPAPAGPFDVQVYLSPDATINVTSSGTFGSNPADTLVQTFQVSGVPANGSTTGTWSVPLPNGFQPGNEYLGMVINPDNAALEQNHANNSNRGLALDVAPVSIVGRTELEPNDLFATANPIDPNSFDAGTIGTVGDVDYYSVTVPTGFIGDTGRLIVDVQATGSLDAQATLFAPDHSILAQSDDRRPGNVNPLLDVHVNPGTYYVAIAASAAAQSAAASGSYTLKMTYVAARPPNTFPSGTTAPNLAVVGDFNGDGIPDLAVASSYDPGIQINYGLGDGTFRDGTFIDTESNATALLAAHLTADGALDLVVANDLSNDVQVFLGDGHGVFQEAPQPNLPNGIRPVSLAVADLNHDGRMDLLVGEGTDPENPIGFLIPTSEVDVLLGHGDGTFADPTSFRLADNDPPRVLIVADVNGDHVPDIVAGAISTGDEFDITQTFGDVSGGVHVLYGNGNGTFAADMKLAGSGGTLGLAAGDFNGDGVTDLAAFSQHATLDSLGIPQSSRIGIDVFLGTGHGAFALPAFYPISTSFPSTLIAKDVNRDGVLDLLAVNHEDNSVAVLLGTGQGTFQPLLRAAAGLQPSDLAVADLNGDGFLDLVTVDGGDPSSISSFFSFSNPLNTLTVVLGNGDGTFRGPSRFDVGTNPHGSVVGDFNDDGVPDLAIADSGADAVSLLPGNGNGTFGTQSLVPLPAGTAPVAIVAADFNGDGRTDFATANSGNDSISVGLGIGNGTFTTHTTASYLLSFIPVAMVTDDFNGDGRPDLAVAGINSTTGHVDIAILLNSGNGQFLSPKTLDTGLVAGYPVTDLYDVLVATDFIPTLALAVGDLNQDGNPDLALVQQGTNVVSVFFGQKDGTLRAIYNKYALPAGTDPTDVLIADFNHDHLPDLAVANASTASAGTPVNGVTVFLNSPGGHFTPTFYAVSDAPFGLAAGAFFTLINFGSADQVGPNIDLAIRMNNSQVAYLNNPYGTGEFGAFDSALVSGAPTSVTNTLPLAGIYAGDLNGDGNTDLVQVFTTGYVEPLLNGNIDPIIDASLLPQEGASSAPVFADVTGDGIADSLTLASGGDILLRIGRGNDAFAPPILVNAGRPASSFTLYRAGAAERLAVVDPSGHEVALYAFGKDGSITLLDTLSGAFPSVIVAADLNGDGRDDLIVANDATDLTFPNLLQGHVSIYLTQPNGTFGAPSNYDAGGGPSAVTVADVNGDRKPDLIVANRISGDISVLLNQGNGVFSPQTRVRAGFGLYQAGDSPLQLDADNRTIQASEDTNAVTAGDFTGDNLPDLIAVDSKSNTLALLQGKGNGAFADPVPIPTAGNHPIAIATADLNGDGHLDLVVLNSVSADLTVYLGDGHGGFQVAQRIAAGNQPTGLTLRDINGDGKLDAVVTNVYGDLLFLLGKGDGAFKPYQRIDHYVSLAVQSATHFILGDHANDTITIAGGLNLPGTVFQDRANGILAPGEVQVVNVGGVAYLVVANSGANDVLVYRADANGAFDPATLQTFPVGTDPVGITVASLNGDDIPDLVIANEGSNDLSLLFGNFTADGWTLTAGPRLKSGGIGPVATVVQPGNGSANPAILISNSQSNNVALIPGVGNGLFNDQSPQTFSVGDYPGKLEIGNFGDGAGNDLAVVSANSITIIANFVSAPVSTSIDIGGSFGLFGDFTNDGFTDIAVANPAGVVALLLGGANGLTLDGLQQVNDPSELALAGMQGNQLSLYLSQNGSDSVGRLTFTLDVGVPVIVPGNGGNGSGIDRAQLAELTSIATDADLSVVAVVVTGRDSFFVTDFSTSISADTLAYLTLPPADNFVSLEINVRFSAGDLTQLPDQNDPLTLFIIGLDRADGQVRFLFRIRVPAPGGSRLPSRGEDLALAQEPPILQTLWTWFEKWTSASGPAFQAPLAAPRAEAGVVPLEADPPPPVPEAASTKDSAARKSLESAALLAALAGYFLTSDPTMGRPCRSPEAVRTRVPPA